MGKLSIEGITSIRYWISGSWMLLTLNLSTILSKVGWSINSIQGYQGQVILGKIFIVTSFVLMMTTVSPFLRKLLISEKRFNVYKPISFIALGLTLLVLGSVALVIGLLRSHGMCIPTRTSQC